MSIPRNCCFAAALLLLPLCFTFAQAAPKAQPAAKPDYSQEAAVIELLSARYNFESDGTGTSETTARVKVQSDAGAQQYGLLVFPYVKSAENMEVVYVRVRKPDGAVVVTPPDYIQDMPSEVTRVAPLYSDLRELHVAVKGLAPGDVLEYQSRSRVHTPIVRGQFWFRYNFVHDGIVLDEQLRLSLPHERAIKMKSADVQPAVADEGPSRVYTWKTSNLRRKTDEEKARESKRDLPPPSVQLSTFRTWEEVGNWYRELQRERVTPSPEIRAKAAELTRSASTDADKLRAIYRYVSTEFRYIGLDFGIGLYQPHTAADVLSNQYGDCKDKHTLLASLLQAVGITAYPVLINAERKIDPDVPSPSQFNHLIGLVPLGKDLFWLDTTAEVAPFGYLVPPLRDKQALVIRDTPELRKTPADPPFATLSTFEGEGTLNADGTVEAKIEASQRGDFEVALRAAFRRVPQPQWKELAQRLSYSSGFAGTVDQVHASSPVATDEPFRFGYSYLRKDYADWPNHRILPLLPPIAMPPAREEDDVSTDPIELGPPGSWAFHSRLKLPAGYSPELPAAVDLKSDFGEYHARSELKDGVLYTDRSFKLLAREVPASRRPEYRKFVRAMSDDEMSYIALKSSSGTAAAAAAAAPDADTARLFDQARNAFQHRDATAAEDYLKQVLARDPKYPRAWVAMGTLAAMRGDFETAYQHFNHEIANHPDDVIAYKALIELQIQRKRPDDAIRSLRGLLKVAPEDRDGITQLTPLLIAQKQFAEAVQVAERGLKLDPNSSKLLFGYANANLWAGQTEKAIASFDKAVEQDPTALNLNNAAYQLSEANVALDRARKWAEKAVADIEAGTRNSSLASLDIKDVRRPSSIAAYWDTLGWIYFRQGDLERAEQYLDSAWLLTQNPVIGDHLGQVYERQGKIKEAARVYGLALASGNEFPALRERFERLNPGKKNQTIKTPEGKAVQLRGADELSRMRTVHLPRIASKGTAEFFLVFSAGPKMDDAKFISGSQELRDAGKAFAAAKFDMRFPEGSQARIIRRGILACYPTSGCDLVLLTADSVRSVE